MSVSSAEKRDSDASIVTPSAWKMVPWPCPLCARDMLTDYRDACDYCHRSMHADCLGKRPLYPRNRMGFIFYICVCCFEQEL